MADELTVDLITGWSPCGPYTRDRVTELVGSGTTPAEMRALPIPAEDRFWVLAHLLSESDCYLLAAQIAERAMESLAVTHSSSKNLVRVLKRFAKGKESKWDLKVAWQAAKSAKLDVREPWSKIQHGWASWAEEREDETDTFIHAYYVAKQTAKVLADDNVWEAALDDVMAMIEAS